LAATAFARVLDVKDGLIRIGEGFVAVAFAILGALLIDGELNGVDYIWDEVERVLESNSNAGVVCCVGEELDILGVYTGRIAKAVFVVLELKLC
jgi:hypothetical protein